MHLMLSEFKCLIRRGILCIIVLISSCFHASADSPYALACSTYLGGSGWEHARDIFADSDGNIYIVGGTGPDRGTAITNNFPTTPGAYSNTHITAAQPNGYNMGVDTGTGVGRFGTCDAFVVKYNASGQVLWSTFVGGPGYDRAYAVEVDASGDIYISGRAGPGFPTTEGSMQPTFAGTTGGSGDYGHQNGFVAKLSPDGSQLLWATYVGTGQLVRDFDIDDDGDVYALLTQAATSNNTLPSAFTGKFTGAFRPTAASGSNTECGVVKIKGDGTQVLWATWLGGSGDDSTAASLRVNDATKCPYALFYTDSTNIVTAGGGADTTHNGMKDMFLAALNSTGSALLYGTYIGGSENDVMETHSLALDASGNAYVLTGTRSPDFPVTAGTFSTVLNGGADIGVTKIGSQGQVIASTLIGGTGGENPDGIYVDATGRIVVVGETSSTDFPVTTGTAHQSSNRGGNDGLMFVLSPDMTTIEYSTYLGGSNYDNGRGGFLGPDGAIYISGGTLSTNLPSIHAADSSFGGGSHQYAPGSGDAILAKFCRTDDSDGDGKTDIDEFLAGTDTLDAADYYSVKQYSLDGTGFHVTVPGRQGRNYTLERSTDLISWSPITSTGPLTSAQELTLVDPEPPDPKAFYRATFIFP